MILSMIISSIGLLYISSGSIFNIHSYCLLSIILYYVNHFYIINRFKHYFIKYKMTLLAKKKIMSNWYMVNDSDLLNTIGQKIFDVNPEFLSKASKDGTNVNLDELPDELIIDIWNFIKTNLML